MHLEIISAQKQHALAFAELILPAMEDLIYFYLGEENKTKALAFLQDQFLLEESLYSYAHTLVAFSESECVGALIAYDSDKHVKLQQKLQVYLQENHDFKDQLTPETEAGEFYLDALSVDPRFRGKKIGSQLIGYAENLARERKHSHLGLLVDTENPKAKRLYERLDFKVVNNKNLSGQKYEHLQKKLF